MMTQQKADAIFSTDLGMQLDMIFVTADDIPFIRYSDAKNHALTRQDEDPDFDTTITEWYPSWDDV